MRCPAAFLALLLCLYWTRAQGESGGLTENDVTQTNITPDIWAELKELRDMVIIHSIELRNSKSNIEKLEQENTDLKARLNSGEKVVEELKRENTDLKARLNTGEKVVEELKRENTAIQDRLTASEIKNAVLETRMNASDNKVEELERENTVLEARMNAGENLVEELQREIIVLKARLNTGEKVVEELQTENTMFEARMNSNELQVEELKRQIAEQPKVAFSVGLTDAGRVGPFSTDTTLKFSKIFTNIGQAYNPTTGIFTAPVRGTYYFRFNAWETRDTQVVGLKLYHNDKQMTLTYDKVVSNGYATVSNAFILQLEKGDVIYLALWSSYTVYDNSYNLTTFSGFLLFAM